MLLSINQISELTGQDRRTIAKRLSDLKHTGARAWRGDEYRELLLISNELFDRSRSLRIANRSICIS